MKVLFTYRAKVGTQRNTEEHRRTQRNTENGRFAPDKKLDEKNNPNYLVCKNNCVPLQYEN